jgi:undecaprenyl-diphosphatase
MTILQAILLGIVQGITEFLPISSSGHLVLVPAFLGWDIPQREAFVFDILVQTGTLVAVIAYFWADLLSIFHAWWEALNTRAPFSTPNARLGWYILLATLPGLGFGFFFKGVFEQAFGTPRTTAFFLLGTSGLLVWAEFFGKRRRQLKELTWLDSLWIGFSQVLALFPGVSRSGATIAGGMTRHLTRSSAARFSFLMAIPIMLAAGFSALYDLSQIPNNDGLWLTNLIGLLTAGIVGYFSISWLMKHLTKRSLYIFAVYCVLLSLVSLIILQ